MKRIDKRVAFAICLMFASPVWAEAGNGFKQLDSDGDGRISPDEYRAAAVARADRQFKQADSNGDGYLSPDELRAAYQRLGDWLRQHGSGQ